MRALLSVAAPCAGKQDLFNGDPRISVIHGYRYQFSRTPGILYIICLPLPESIPMFLNGMGARVKVCWV